MKKIRTVIAGYEHPHIMALVRTLNNYPDDFEIVAFADVKPGDQKTHDGYRKFILEKVPGIAEYEDIRDLIALKPDFAVVASDNASRREVCAYFLQKGIHVLDEKPMAMTADDSAELCRLAKENHVRMLTNWPIAWFPAFRLAKKLLDEGRIGKLMRVTYRSPATWGPFSYSKDGSFPTEDELLTSWWYHKERGGGSVLDYACYGTMLSSWMFGKQAESVSGITKSFTTGFSDVEDFSAMILDFGDGVGLLEGSWSTYNCGEIPTGPVLYGENGVIVCDRHTGSVKLYEGKSHTPVPPTEEFPTEKDRQSELLGQHLAKVLRGEEEPDPMLGEKLNYAVSAALDAGRLSAETGVTVKTKKYDLD